MLVKLLVNDLIIAWLSVSGPVPFAFICTPETVKVPVPVAVIEDVPLALMVALAKLNAPDPINSSRAAPDMVKGVLCAFAILEIIL